MWITVQNELRSGGEAYQLRHSDGSPVTYREVIDLFGGLIVRSPNPLEIGPLTVRDGETAQVQNLTMRVDPVVEVSEAGDLRFDLQTLTMLDRYGEILQGNLSGSMAAAERDEGNPLAGIRLEGAFDVGLQELFQQPALAEMASIVSGRAQVNVNIDGESALDAADAPEALPVADLVIDAAYGTGFQGAYRPPDALAHDIAAVRARPPGPLVRRAPGLTRRGGERAAGWPPSTQRPSRDHRDLRPRRSRARCRPTRGGRARRWTPGRSRPGLRFRS